MPMLDKGATIHIATNDDLRQAALAAQARGDMQTVAALNLIAQLPAPACHCESLPVPEYDCLHDFVTPARETQ